MNTTGACVRYVTGSSTEIAEEAGRAAIIDIISVGLRTDGTAVRFCDASDEDICDPPVPGRTKAGPATGYWLAEVLVAVSDPGLHLSRKQATDLLTEHPTLAEHACRQQGIGMFAEKILEADLPHVLEHLAIDSLVSGLGAQIVGNTSWQSRSEGLAKIRLKMPAGHTPLMESDIQQRFERILEQAVDELNRLVV